MAKNWAIVIGINNYYNLQKLDFAENDAKEMEHWFRQEAKFDQVFLFTENSPPILTNTQPIPTEPTFGILMNFLGRQFKNRLLTTGDNLWFFFSGHGQRYQDKDYLMLKDTDPGNIERTAISVEYVTETLRGSGADNVILFLDACRNQGGKDGLGYGEEQYQGVITFYSCTAEQRAWEISELAKGAFTHTLLEGLRLHGEGNCATVERLYRHLISRIPQLNQEYRKPIQNPYLKAEPPYKMYYILLPKSANSRDILPLQNEAMNAEIHNDLELAEKLWIRILAVDGTDNQALSGIKRIAIKTDKVDRGENPQIEKTGESKKIDGQDKSAGNTSSETTQPAVERWAVVLDKILPQKIQQPRIQETKDIDKFNQPIVNPPIGTDLERVKKEPRVVEAVPAYSPHKYITDKDKKELIKTPRRGFLKIAGLATGGLILVLMTQQIFENQEATIPTDKLPQPEPTKTTQIDFTNLESLLKVRNFKQADEETYKLMLAVANRESEGYLITYQDAEKFPCKELRTIDQLWLKYSQGKFGISVQQQIYQSLGGTKESRLDVYDALGDKLGWRRKGQWLDYNNLNFSQTAPSGHLPAAAWDTGNFDGGLNFIAGGSDYNCF